jgi:hypothetical protein
MKKKTISERQLSTESEAVLPNQKELNQFQRQTDGTGKLLPGDDISSLTPEEREIRRQRIAKAISNFMLSLARAKEQANPSGFSKVH